MRWSTRGSSSAARTVPTAARAELERRLHLVLIGDSIFDNGAYTGADPDVITHLGRLLPTGWRATLAAVDGATTRGIYSQIGRVPADATHLAVSVGGNDALGHMDLLSTRVASTAAALDLFHQRVAGFERDYCAALDAVLAVGLPTVVCTIYNGALPDAAEARRARVALTLFNDVILRAAWVRRCAIVELRLLCAEAADYANPIEPSGPGGLKIATALARTAGALREKEASAYRPHAGIV